MSWFNRFFDKPAKKNKDLIKNHMIFYCIHSSFKIILIYNKWLNIWHLPSCFSVFTSFMLITSNLRHKSRGILLYSKSWATLSMSSSFPFSEFHSWMIGLKELKITKMLFTRKAQSTHMSTWWLVISLRRFLFTSHIQIWSRSLSQAMLFTSITNTGNWPSH